VVCAPEHCGSGVLCRTVYVCAHHTHVLFVVELIVFLCVCVEWDLCGVYNDATVSDYKWSLIKEVSQR